MNTRFCTSPAKRPAMSRPTMARPTMARLFRTGTRLCLCTALATAVLLGLSMPSQAQTDQPGEPQMTLQRIKITAGMHQIDTQVAATPEQRQTGLMWRKSMPMHEGMLFIFEQPSQQCFWMKNTLIPLTAAFVADDGTIVNLEDMKPQTTEPHCSAKPVRYVLEMNKGWFAKKGIMAGGKLVGEPFRYK